MATNSLQPLHHHRHSLRRRHFFSAAPSTASSFLKLITATNIASISHSQSISTVTFALSPSSSSSATTSSAASATGDTSLDHLKDTLSAKNYREADEETRRLIIALAGDAAVKRGYVFFSEVQFIPEDALKTIDDLWRQNSDNKFGYSIQKKIWKKSRRDFSKFFVKVGWMKKLDTEVVQYNYRSFPSEFIWELQNDTPEGHLPLTNALRGTQLLNCLLNHSAFKTSEDEVEDEEMEENGGGNNAAGLMGVKPLNKKVFTTDYGF